MLTALARLVQVLKAAAAGGQANATVFLAAVQQPQQQHLLEAVEWAMNQVQAAMANA